MTYLITSPQNDRVKLAHTLQTQAKSRRKEQKIALEGLRLVTDAIAFSGLQPDFILYAEGKLEQNLRDRLERQKLTVLPVTDEIMRYISVTEEPSGVVAVFPMPEAYPPETLSQTLILDNLRDPGNVGTLLRTAAAAGVDAVLLSPGCVDAYNPKVLRSAMGAHFRVPVIEASWEKIASLCPVDTVYLADMEGDLTYDAVDWRSSWALIIGSEAHGATPEAMRLARERVYIPMSADAESLNAAIAAGIFLFEARRQRQTG